MSYIEVLTCDVVPPNDLLRRMAELDKTVPAEQLSTTVDKIQQEHVSDAHTPPGTDHTPRTPHMVTMTTPSTTHPQPYDYPHPQPPRPCTDHTLMAMLICTCRNRGVHNLQTFFRKQKRREWYVHQHHYVQLYACRYTV